MEQVPHGSGHSLKLSECKKLLDNAFRNRVWILLDPVLSQELDFMILVSPF